MLNEIRQKWSAPFHEYYMNEIAPDITSIARWVIEPYGVYDPYSGITNNQAEGLKGGEEPRPCNLWEPLSILGAASNTFNPTIW